MVSRRTILTILLSSLLVLVGCGSSTKDDSKPDEASDSYESADGFSEDEYEEDDDQESLTERNEARVLVESSGEGNGYYYINRWDYDNNGALKTGYYSDSDDGTIDSIEQYESNSDGKCTSRAKYNVAQYDPVNGTYRLGSLINRIDYEYDGNSYIARVYNSEGSLTQEDSYDEHDNLVHRKYYNSDGTLDDDRYESNEYEYNSNGNIVNSIEFYTDSDGSCTSTRKTINEYNDDGHITHQLSIYEAKNRYGGGGDSDDYDRTYSYDNLGRVKKVDYGPEDSNPGYYDIYYYDSEDAIMPYRVEVHYADGKVREAFNYRYDIDGHTIIYKGEEGSDGDIDDEYYWYYAYVSDVADYQILTED